jgi:hypothetical protein
MSGASTDDGVTAKIWPMLNVICSNRKHILTTGIERS